jgi:hypothetical protein
VRKKIFKAVLASILLISSISPANAGLDAPVNLDNPRVVPIYGGPFDAASWSGYLYSSRIIFSAAHSNYKFDSNGNRILNEPAVITVGRPNSSAKDFTGRVKVIKTFVADFSSGGLNDFIVYVLEKDLISMQPSKLLTTEIEQELVAVKAEISMHGYGEYRDRCSSGEKNPCKKDWNNPNQRTSELPRIMRMNLTPLSDFHIKRLIGNQRAVLKETIISNHKPCSGDSGGPITTTYNGAILYLGQGLNGMNVYACGAGDSKTKENDADSFGFFSPIYKHLDLLKEAEAFAAQQSAPVASTKKTVTIPNRKKTTITCTKGKVTKKVTATKPKCPKSYKKK